MMLKFSNYFGSDPRMANTAKNGTNGNVKKQFATQVQQYRATGIVAMFAIHR